MKDFAKEWREAVVKTANTPIYPYYVAFYNAYNRVCDMSLKTFATIEEANDFGKAHLGDYPDFKKFKVEKRSFIYIPLSMKGLRFEGYKEGQFFSLSGEVVGRYYDKI